MSQYAAKKIMEVATRHLAEQDAVLIQIQSLCTKDEFGEYRRMIGRTMGAMLFEIIYPVAEDEFREYRGMIGRTMGAMLFEIPLSQNILN